MSFASRLTNTCTIYRYTKAASYPFTETWAATATSVPCLKVARSKREAVADGSEVLVTDETVYMQPRDIKERDRILIDGGVYGVDAVTDAHGRGRELIVRVNRLPDGTAAEMGIS